MKINKLSWKGIGRFNTNETKELPLDRLNEAKLISVQGFNGAGKSTALGCISGALYRLFPDYGAVHEMANQSDSFINLEVESDDIYKAQIEINASTKKAKTKAFLYNSEGLPLSESGKVGDFDQEVAKHFPSKEVFLSSAFASQTGKGKFLDLPKADRKALFIEMLGQGKLQQMSELANKKAKNIENEVLSLREKAKDLRDKANQLDSIKKELKKEQDTLKSTLTKKEEYESKLKDYQNNLKKWEKAKNEIDKELYEKQSEIKNLENSFRQQSKKIDELQNKRDEIVLEKEKLNAKLESKQSLENLINKGNKAKEEIEQIETEIEELTQKEITYKEKLLDYQKKENELSSRLGLIRQEERHEINNLKRKQDDLDDKLEKSRKRSLKLKGVPCNAEGEFSTCPLITDAIESKEQLPIILEEIKVVEKAIESGCIKYHNQIVSAQKELDELKNKKPIKPDTNSKNMLVQSMNNLKTQVNEAESASKELAKLDEISNQVKKLTLENEELTTKIHEEKYEYDCIEHSIIAHKNQQNMILNKMDTHETTKPKDQYTSKLEDIISLEKDLISLTSKLEERLKAAKEAKNQYDSLVATGKQQVQQLDDWKHLAKALGKDGIQALEIDLAGPQVSTIINDLLHTCYGTRFSVELKTTETKADGKGTKEVFDLVVHDSERDRQANADNFSGGEKVLINEAISLAIAIYNCQQSHIPIYDLFRDECAGALHHEAAPKYIEMLRKALKIGNFHRVFFVSHNPELWELADRRIIFDNGNISLN